MVDFFLNYTVPLVVAALLVVQGVLGALRYQTSEHRQAMWQRIMGIALLLWVVIIVGREVQSWSQALLIGAIILVWQIYHLNRPHSARRQAWLAFLIANTLHLTADMTVLELSRQTGNMELLIVQTLSLLAHESVKVATLGWLRKTRIQQITQAVSVILGGGLGWLAVHAWTIPNLDHPYVESILVAIVASSALSIALESLGVFHHHDHKH